MAYSSNKFEIKTQYAEFYQNYQNIVKRDFLSSKLFIFLCALTFTTSLISISYFSNLRLGLNSNLNYKLTTPNLPALSTIKVTQFAETQKLKTFEETKKISEMFKKQLDILMLKPKFSPRVLVNNIKPPELLPAIPSFDFNRTFEIKKSETTKPNKAPNPNQLAVVDFKIKKNLLKDTKRAGFSRFLTNELTRAFSEKLDIKKVQPGDRFTVLYSQQQGKILAAKYISRNKVIKVVRLSEGLHKGAFFHMDKLQETTLPKSTVSLLRKPVKSGRVSSPFQAHRFHPILKRYRAHLGVDYAAAKGSPIIASGNGKVTFVGYRQGYGNLVVIQHDKKYSTRYGHMARFSKIKPGSMVKQGQVIGFVGRSGYATGHHVHYEIRVDGKAYNPLTVALPNMRKAVQPTLSKQRRQEIVSKARLLFAKMDELNKKNNS